MITKAPESTNDYQKKLSNYNKIINVDIYCPICFEKDISPGNLVYIYDCGHWVCADCTIKLDRLQCCLCNNNVKQFKFVGNSGTQIFIKDNKTHTVCIDLEKHSVLQLKKLFLLKNHIGTEFVNNICIMYCGKQLQNDSLLKEYNICDRSTLFLIWRK
jgi:Ubiquitin family/Zinc finger, C3HC4 type (RING finger)